MNTSTCDKDDFCWLCSAPGFCCNCELSESSWSKLSSEECTFDGREEPARLDVNDPSFCTVYGNFFLAGAFDSPDFKLDVVLPRFRRGSQRPYAASTPKNNSDTENWESPGAIAPPESSSPVGFDADSSPPTWTSCREDRAMDRGSLDDEQWRVEVLYSHPADSNTPMPPTTTSMSRSSPLSANSSMAVQGSLDERSRAIGRQVMGDALDGCVVPSQTLVDGTGELGMNDGFGSLSASGNHAPAARESALFSCPTVFDLAKWNELETALPPSTEGDAPYNATTTSSETSRNGVLSEMPCREVSLCSVSCLPQAIMRNGLKRRRSLVGTVECKRAKLDRSVSHVSCASEASVQTKYQATEPASLRRAQSLKSDVSECSEASMDSLFGSPLSPLITRPFPDKDYPPTAPSTPLPNSADYARSRANPLARTFADYSRRSRIIPPVPIIAPPPRVQCTVVRCPEDYAIDRIEALLRREHSERERDGLNVYDIKRTERLTAIYGTDPSCAALDDASTVDSNEDDHLWEEETATESQESQQLSKNLKIQILSEQYRLANRQAWTYAYGVGDDVRKEIARWILEAVPKEPDLLPANASRDERPGGIDLYDQLTHSRHTRFHAAQLFHRYFLLPEKVEYWREVRCAHFTSEHWRLYDDFNYERGVWDLAIACMALSVKLHRDCLLPLRPVFAFEFLEMARHSMTQDALELAQRDVLYSFRFQLGSCTPQDVLDELWNALPTLRKATAQIGWAAVQCVTWDKLFGSLLEPDMLQYPVTLLTAAALVDSLAFALACQYKTEDVNVCMCRNLVQAPVFAYALDDTEPTSWQIHLFEASQLVDDVILDVRDVLHLSPMELDECRMWLSHVGRV